MSEPRTRNDVLNPCPNCGKRFDVMGCMTFVDQHLEASHGGKCPTCRTRVVVQVSDPLQPEAWERAMTLHAIRAVLIDELYLSVRTRVVLRRVGITTVGDLLDSTEARIRRGDRASDSMI